ncbi:hypothetical protein [Bradyrhizobium sp.]|uniref:hypothetical protein n=1 Tax=Bradyrhizobium sp. TaxID=376 RepID=UPI0025C3E5CB|nr:hypothetical protein [Bradyrhizobium sp.]
MSADVETVRFDVPAKVRKWPSLNNSRREGGTGPYFVLEGTLEECIKNFMARPEGTRHLYDIKTIPQPPLIAEIINAEQVVELVRMRRIL